MDNRLKDPVSREFRKTYKTQKGRGKLKIRLAEDILDIWAAHFPTTKGRIGTFKGALKFRLWLAHGRYWIPKFGRKYDPNVLIHIITELFDEIGIAAIN